jgi:hypothetical protein
VKVSSLALLAGFCTLLVGGGEAKAYIGFGYRANEPVRVDRCYRGLAWNYAVPFYVYTPKQRYYYRKKCLKR